MKASNLRHTYIHKVSNANEDLMRKELNLFDPSYTRPKIRKLAMTVDKDCFLIINGDRIKVLASLGLNWEAGTRLKASDIQRLKNHCCPSETS